VQKHEKKPKAMLASCSLQTKAAAQILRSGITLRITGIAMFNALDGMTGMRLLPTETGS
jgi:hypothetical protein